MLEIHSGDWRWKSNINHKKMEKMFARKHSLTYVGREQRNIEWFNENSIVIGEMFCYLFM